MEPTQNGARAADGLSLPCLGRMPDHRVNGINYGGLLFTNPVPLAYALAPNDPGLFAIQVRNLSYGPLPFQPIAFGGAANLPNVAFEALPDYEEWRAHRLADSGLFVSYCALRYESESYRASMQVELEAQYLRRAAAGPVGEALAYATALRRDVK